MNEMQKAWLNLMAAIIKEAQNADTDEAYDEAVGKMREQIEIAPEP